MDFTREPIIETVISPRDGYKILIRNSKEANQEEYLVNAVEIVSFGSALFFRCLEKTPRAFLLPIADYDIIEVKEARMVMKNISTDKPIKIAEGNKPNPKETPPAPRNDKEEAKPSENENKKTSKKRHSRKRRSGKPNNEKESIADRESAATEEVQSENLESSDSQEHKPAEKKIHKREKHESKHFSENRTGDMPAAPPVVVSVIFPPAPKIIGKTTLPPAPVRSFDKEVFPEAVKESRDETHVATSKDLPSLDEVKESKDHKKSAEKAESTQE